MLKKESFFQYLFVQSIGQSTTKLKIDSQKLNKTENFKVLKIKNLVNGLVPPQSINKTIEERQHPERVDVASTSEKNSKTLIELKPIKIKSIKSQTFLLLFNKNLPRNPKTSNYIELKKQSQKKQYLSTIKSYVNPQSVVTKQDRSTVNKETIGDKKTTINNYDWGGQRPPRRKMSFENVIRYQPGTHEDQNISEKYSITKRKLKISRNIFLINKELKKVYSHNTFTDHILKKDSDDFSCIEKSAGRRLSKKQNKKELVYNVFLTYKKSFLSYWLLPFLGIISLTNSSLGLTRISQDNSKILVNTDTTSTREAQNLSSRQIVPNLLFFDKQHKSTKIKNTNHQLIPLEDVVSTRTLKTNELDNFVHTNVMQKQMSYSLSILNVNQTGVENYKISKQYEPTDAVDFYLSTPNNYSIPSTDLTHDKKEFTVNNNSIKLKTLFFNLFNLKYNSDFLKLDKNKTGSNVEFNKKLLKLLFKTEGHLNLKELNMELLNSFLITQNTSKLQWYDYVLKKNALVSNSDTKELNIGPSTTSWQQPTRSFYFPNKIIAPHLKINFNRKRIQTKKTFLEIIENYTANKKLQPSTSAKKIERTLNTISRSLSKNNIEPERQYFKKNIDIKRTPTFYMMALMKGRPQQPELPIFKNVQNQEKVLIGISSSVNMKRPNQLEHSAMLRPLVDQDSFFSKNMRTTTKQVSIQQKTKNIETPEKSLKKASFLLDFLVLNNFNLNKFLSQNQNTVSIENIIKTNNLKDNQHTSRINIERRFAMRNDATVNLEEQDVLALDFVKSSRKLNETIVLLLKNKKSKDLKKDQNLTKTGTFHLKPQSLNNRNLLYNNLFEGLKNSINYLYLNNAGDNCDPNSEIIKNAKDKVLKLNQPFLGGSLSVMQEHNEQVSMEKDNNNARNESICGVSPICQLTSPMFKEIKDSRIETNNIEHPLKSKINLRLTKLPILETLSTRPARPHSKDQTNFNISKNQTHTSDSSSIVSQSFWPLNNKGETPSEARNKKIKNIKGDLNISNNTIGYSSNATLKQQENKQNSKVRVDPSLSIFNDYIKALTKQIKKGLNPYKNQIGLTYLWEKNSIDKLKNSKRFDTLHVSNKSKAKALKGLYFRISKIGQSFSPARFEKIFLSYLSKSKLGSNKRKNIGNLARRMNTSTVNSVFAQNHITLGKQDRSQIETMHATRTSRFTRSSGLQGAERVDRIPLKIKKLTENELLLHKLKKKNIGDTPNELHSQTDLPLGPLFKDAQIGNNLDKTNTFRTSSYFLKSNSSTIKPIIKKTLKYGAVGLERIRHNMHPSRTSRETRSSGLQRAPRVDQEGMLNWNKNAFNMLGKSTKIIKNSRKSFLMFMKNRIFVNKQQNSEYWGPLTNQNKVLTSRKTSAGRRAERDIQTLDRYSTSNNTTNIGEAEKQANFTFSNTSIKETRRKKKQLKLKRRLKKMQCATRRRKKRKIFYPRPKWLTFKMYNNFLNTRFTNTLPNQSSLNKEHLKKRGPLTLNARSALTLPWLKNTITLTKINNTKQITQLEGMQTSLNNSKDFYRIAPAVSRELRRILMKSNWLRNYLNPYLDKIKNIYKELEMDSKNIDFLKKISLFIQKIYAPANLEANHDASTPSKRFHQHSLFKEHVDISESIVQFEYNRIIYQRIQRIILNIRDNLNLNGQFKNQSQKVGKNIRPFIKRDYIKRVNNVTGSQNENIFAKSLKKQIINFSRNFILLNNGYEEPTIYATNQISPFVQNNFYWALNRTERLNDSNSNTSFLKKLWEKYKIREINKNNKTKKMIFNIVNKYNDLLNDQNVLDSFNLNLETDYTQVKHFYKQSPFNIKKSSHKNRIGYGNSVWELPFNDNEGITETAKLEENKSNSFFSEYNLNQIGNISGNKRRNGNLYNYNSLGELLQSPHTGESNRYYRDAGSTLTGLNAIDNNQNNVNARSALTYLEPQGGSIKIKKALIATKTYIDKTEKKLINIEKKLKLLGLSINNLTKPSYLIAAPTLGVFLHGENTPANFGGRATLWDKKANSTKSLIKNKNFLRITPIIYKKIYFRFLKQELLKESNYFLPYNNKPIGVKNVTGTNKPSFYLKGSSTFDHNVVKPEFRAERDVLDVASAIPFYLQKLQKTYYNIKQKTLTDSLGSQQNISGITIANNIQNYSKFSSNTYWWTKNKINQLLNVNVDADSRYSRIRPITKHTAQFPVEAKLELLLKNQKNTLINSTIPLVQTYGLENRLSKQENNNYLKIKTPVPLISFLFHFCTLITLISLGSVRSVIKFYYILLSKIYKIINQLRFTNFFPTKVQKSNFNVASKSNQKINKTTLAWRLTKNIEENRRTTMKQGNRAFDNASPVSMPEKVAFIAESETTTGDPLPNSILPSQTSREIRSSSLQRAPRVKVGIQLIKTFKTIKLIALKYLLANPSDITFKKQSIAFLLANTENSLIRGKGSTNSHGALIRLDGLSASINHNNNKTSNNLLVKQDTKNELVSLINAYLKTKKVTFQVKPTNISSRTLRVDQVNPLLERSQLTSYLEKMKITTLYNSTNKISMGLNTMYKFSFYTYILLLKSVDILMAPAFLIYKFFEKPGEYVVENIAYSFLLEWSADLISTIPDSIDPAISIYINKLERNLPFYLAITSQGRSGVDVASRQNIFNDSFKTISNLINKTSQTKNLESIFGIFLLAVNNSIIRRLGNASLLMFTQQITEPDLDYINRQKKGIIFWDLWGESLKIIAEKNSVNIYELSTDKEEQLKLLSNMQNLKSLNPWSNYLEPINKTGTRFERAIETNTYQRTPRVDGAFITHNFIRPSFSGPTAFSLSEKAPQRLKPTRTIAFSQRWAVNQFLNYQGKDTDLFIDLHPPRSFSNTATSLKYAFSIQAPIGSLVCQIFGGIFYKQISKNILVVLHKTSQTLEKSLLIQAIAGETELKIITDNAHRYAMVIQGVAVGIKLLKDVFEALCATGPCIFLLEDIHAIGERRPFLIDEASPNLTESIYNKNQSMQSFLLKEKSNASREILYKTNKHLLTNYKKPYKEFKSLASNHFSFTFLYRAGNFTNLRMSKINTADVPLPIQVSKKDKESQDQNLGIKKDSVDTTKNLRHGLISSKTDKTNKTDQIKVFGTFSELINSIKNKQSLINPPASSPFNLLLMKESSKLKPNQTVKEMAWFGLPGEQYSLLSKYNFSIRVKVALLADSVLSNLSVKLEMITDLLVIIDSVKGNRGFIIFATTHLPDILDPALRRPGRFDETLSLPFIPALYSRWTNYRYNVKYLNSSLFNQYSISLNNIFNKGFVDTLSRKGESTTTLDFSNYPACYNESQMEAVLPIYSSLAFFGHKAQTQKRYFCNGIDLISTTSITRSKINDRGEWPIATLITQTNNSEDVLSVSELIKSLLHYSYTRATSYASNTVISLMLYTSQTKVDELVLSTKQDLTKPGQLKWPTMLKEANLNNNFLENYTNYLSLFGPLHFNKTSMGQVLLMSFITYKFGETFGCSTKLKNQKSPRVLLQDLEWTTNVERNRLKDSTKERPLTISKKKKGNNPSTTINLPFLVNINKNANGKIGGQSATRFAPASLLSNYLQKRLPYIGSSKNLKNNLNYTTFYSNHLLNFNNQYSLMEPPSPPITNILLPAKRYENYRRSFKSFHNLIFDTKTVSEKLKLHQQQRLLKRLYNYPIKDFFRNEKFSWFIRNRSDQQTPDPMKLIGVSTIPELSTQGNVNALRALTSTRTRLPKNNFTQSYFIFAGIENFIQKNMASLNQFSSIDYSYRHLLYNRHKTYLTNQWWNGQQGEHNLESTFLSDIDWRYTQINRTSKNINSGLNKIIGDSKSIREANRQIQVDFPDCEQFYNPRNRRWFLTKGDWNYWFNLNAVTSENSNEIYMHYISESLTKAFKTIDQNREFLDFYAAKLLSSSFNLLNVRESQSTLKQRRLKTKSNISFEDLNHRNILNLYKRFYNP